MIENQNQCTPLFVIHLYGQSIVSYFCAKQDWDQTKITCYLLQKIFAYLSRPTACWTIFASRPYLTVPTTAKLLWHKLPNPNQFPTWWDPPYTHSALALKLCKYTTPTPDFPPLKYYQDSVKKVFFIEISLINLTFLDQ